MQAMRLQLLSDLHLETEIYHPQAAPEAELLVLAGDIDSRWDALAHFKDWPVPVLMVAGNHEFDGRELDEAWPALRARCASLGIQLLEQGSVILSGADGRRIRFCGTVRWSDFDLFGASQRERAMRAASYFQRVMNSRWRGAPFDAAAVREAGLQCRAWLEQVLSETAQGRWDATCVITHFAPSLRSADPRFGKQPGTASFCCADDDLIVRADLWLHGHLHCRHDYTQARAAQTPSRVVCQARGLARKGEADGWDGLKLITV